MAKKNHVDEQTDFDFAVALRKTVTDAYLLFAMKAIENHQNGKAQKGLSAGFQKDARLVVRAVECGMLDGSESDEWDILYAIECAKAKDGEDAVAIWDTLCVGNADRNFQQVKEAVRSANGNGAARKPTLAERIADAIDFESSLSVLPNGYTWTEWLLKQNEVAAVLKRRADTASAKREKGKT